MDNNKLCAKCQQEKPIEEFVKDKRSKSGYSSECKECAKLRARKYREKYPEREFEKCHRYREKHPEKRKESVKRWATNNREKRRKAGKKWAKNNPDKMRKRNNRYTANNPEKRKAHKAVNRAVDQGILPKISTQKCSYCGKPAQEYHHHNGYDKKHILDVMPTCKLCHCQQHPLQS